MDLVEILRPIWSGGWIAVKLLWPLVVALVVGRVVISRLRCSGFRGRMGERIVSRRLRAGLSDEEYEIVNDVYLPLDDGTTTQIDHVVVSRYGVFVVETKNYTGWIFANAQSRVWTQSVYRRKNTFQNPIRQNYLHLCTISSRLGIPREMLHGVVAFTGDCTFKTEMPDGVVYSRKLADYIRSFDKAILADSEVKDVVLALREWNESVTEEQRRSHVSNLKRRHAQTAGMGRDMLGGGAREPCRAELLFGASEVRYKKES